MRNWVYVAAKYVALVESTNTTALHALHNASGHDLLDPTNRHVAETLSLPDYQNSILNIFLFSNHGLALNT